MSGGHYQVLQNFSWMKVYIKENPEVLGVSAGKKAAALIIETIKEKGSANIILATGTSQFETLDYFLGMAERIKFQEAA